MFYVGQQVERINSGVVHTIQCFQGGGIKLMGRGNTCHPLSLFRPHGDDGLIEIAERNNTAAVGAAKQSLGGYCSVFFGSRNEVGCMSEDEIKFIIHTLIKGGCVLSIVATVDGRYAPGMSEQALDVDVTYPSFPVMFNIVQSILSGMGLAAAGMLDAMGGHLVITDGMFELRGETYLVGIPQGGELKFVRHGDHWAAINFNQQEK